MAGLFVVRLAFTEHVWLRADRIYSADLTGIDMLPRGAKLAVAYPAGAVNFAPIPEVHLPLLAVARREAFVPTLFAADGQQPVTLRPPHAALANAASPVNLWTAIHRYGDGAAGGAELRRTIQQYDYIAAVGDRAREAPVSGCLSPYFSRPNFEIFTVLHEEGCGSPVGG